MKNDNGVLQRQLSVTSNEKVKNIIAEGNFVTKINKEQSSPGSALFYFTQFTALLTSFLQGMVGLVKHSEKGKFFSGNDSSVRLVRKGLPFQFVFHIQAAEPDKW